MLPFFCLFLLEIKSEYIHYWFLNETMSSVQTISKTFLIIKKWKIRRIKINLI